MLKYVKWMFLHKPGNNYLKNQNEYSILILCKNQLSYYNKR